MITRPRVPGATYRLQLHRGFPWSAAVAVLPHLRALGITDIYTSPILQAAPGSTHGYDVIDFERVDEALGGAAGVREFSAALERLGMGWLLDIVPNHMGVDPDLNPWWHDVLARGPQSPYAGFFDIHWDRGDSQARPRVLLPILESHFGVALESGKIELQQRGGAWVVAVSGLHLPVSAETYGQLLGELDGEALEPADRAALARARVEAASPDGAGASDGRTTGEPRERAPGDVLSRPAIAAAGAKILETRRGRPGEPGSFDRLAEILDLQHYRLARWKVGAFEGNYRRFFAIDSLVGLRIEDPEVFARCHARLPELLRQGVTGLRVDHIDGLREPQKYLERLQRLARDSTGSDRTYLIVEKIRAEGEALVPEWPVQGTTGYEFIADLAGLFTDGANRGALEETCRDFCRQPESFSEVLEASKRDMLHELFPGVVAYLTSRLLELVAQDRRKRDFAPAEIGQAIAALMRGFTVYRTYVRATGPISRADRLVVERACQNALGSRPTADPEPVEFVRDVLTGDYQLPGDGPGLSAWVLRFQQYTGAVMAKAQEDTAFYRYHRLAGLNEVGGNPSLCGTSVEYFHRANQVRRTETPYGLVTTSTHDTKFSEDVRARLYALSSFPEAWREWVGRWRELNRGHKSLVLGQEAPSAQEEYRFYQVLLGAWPLDEAELDDTFRQRLQAHLLKASNEAGLQTSWREPNQAWLEAGRKWVGALLDFSRPSAFRADFRAAAATIAEAGMRHSLAQLVLKCTAPGAPDFYQGCETWNFSLVDPDNRRPVDFEKIRRVTARARSASWAGLAAGWRDGAIKVAVMRRLLEHRARTRPLFTEGYYQPLTVTGAGLGRVVACERGHEGHAVAVVVPCRPPPGPGTDWGHTAVTLPRGEWRDLFTEARHLGEAPVAVGALFRILPVAVLVQNRAAPGPRSSVPGANRVSSRT